jgi:hypothetical protein
VPVAQAGAGSCHFREDFMRRPLLLIAAATIAACGGSTSESQPASPYNISVASNSHSGGGASAYITSLTLAVTDTGSTTPHAGVGVTLQVDAGQITSPLPNVTDINGLTSVTWSIDTSLQHPGSIYALAFCAVPPGKTFCITSLTGADAITVSF